MSGTMVLDDNGNLKGGSIQQVMEWLIDSVQNDLIVEKFLSCFPQVASAADVWKVLERKWSNVRDLYRSNVLHFIRVWVEKDFYRDFVRGPKEQFDDLMRFINKLDPREANTFKLLIIKTAQKRRRSQRRLKIKGADLNKSGGIADLHQSPAPSPKKEKMLARASVALGSLGTSSPKSATPGSNPGTPAAIPVQKALEPGKFDIHDLEPLELAQQLTLIEFDTFSRIQDSEFHNVNWKKENSRKVAKNVVTMVSRFNSVCYWVATEIVIQRDVKSRANILKKFIMTAEHLRDMGNFNGVMEIVGGLNMLPVTRLSHTWAELSEKFTQTVEQLNELMETKQNYKVYRERLAMQRPPTLPYLGIVLRDLLFLDEGNTDFIGAKSDGIINVDKLMLKGDLIVQVRRFQETPYPFEHHEIIQDYLSKLVTLPEEMLYKQSVMCEPNKEMQTPPLTPPATPPMSSSTFY